MTFESAFAKAEPYTLLSADKARVLWDSVLTAPDGEVFECGVYKGGSALILAEAIRESGKNRMLRLFDTFTGLPESEEGKAGEFAASMNSVEALLADASRFKPGSVRPEDGNDFVMYGGLITDSFKNRLGLRNAKGFRCHCWDELKDRRIALAHLDLDLYHSTLDAIDFIWPRIVPGGSIIVDDWNFPKWPGVAKAVYEYFGSSPPKAWDIVQTAPFQCRVRKA